MGPVLFAWVSFSLYREIERQQDLQQSWEHIRASAFGSNGWKFLLVLLLMFVNWGIEARKWQVLVRSIQRISFFKAFKAVFSGQSLAVNTPNRVGEYVGRVVYLDEGNRLRGVALTIVGSLSQTIITLLFGLTGMALMSDSITGSIKDILTKTGLLQLYPGLAPIAYDIIFYCVLLGVAIMLIVYFEMSWLTKLIERMPFVKKYSYLIEKLEDFHWAELTRILSLSVSRYAVFVVQFILLLQVFQVNIPFAAAAGLVSVFFLVLAVVPTISSVELSLRGLAAWELFGIMSANKLGIIATAAGIWLINLIIPALAGSLFILGIKLFKR
ncbi:MAG TPA: lysylphosphatidylglycerol synthase domain-containing protein [Chitinophagaceae bacterium]